MNKDGTYTLNKTQRKLIEDILNFAETKPVEIITNHTKLVLQTILEKGIYTEMNGDLLNQLASWYSISK